MRGAMVVLMFIVAACQRTPFADGLPAVIDCAGCHGDNGDPTPPRAVDGTTSTSNIGVGAHQAHMRASGLAAPVACLECHPVPSKADGTEHPDPLGRPAVVRFGVLATQAPANPAWNRSARTCVGTYCHGATLRDAANRAAPVWTDVSPLRCDSCHGNPPPPTHPEGSDCETCHGQVVGAGGVIKNPLLHIDGIVQVGD